MGLFGGPKKPFVFRYYVSVETEHTNQVVGCLKMVLDESICGQYDLEVVSLLFKVKIAKTDGITRTPALACIHPPPMRRFYGYFGSDLAKIRAAFKDMLAGKEKGNSADGVKDIPA
ncbi:MAG: circadian clock KaiB family protein [Candidatus Omnitrophota bacterium]|nr:circadian clock KaiB family protein [Candidatus Omnitrophota bacterium]